MIIYVTTLDFYYFNDLGKVSSTQQRVHFWVAITKWLETLIFGQSVKLKYNFQEM